MAQVTFDEINKPQEASTNQTRVGFFSLKDDGDEAIVRIMHNNVADFDILTVHPVQIDGRFRSVNCIRNAYDPMDSCPLCAAGTQIRQRIYIHMLQYSKDEKGQTICKPVIWERSARDFGSQLKTLIDNYGPLSQSVFKIHRNGRAGDMGTTYNIMYCNPQIFTAEAYPIDVEAFNGYTALGNAVLSKTGEELAYYAQNGVFPNTNTTGSPAGNQATVTGVNPNTGMYEQGLPFESAAGQAALNQQEAGFDRNGIPVWGTGSSNPNPASWDNNGAVARPTRTY